MAAIARTQVFSKSSVFREYHLGDMGTLRGWVILWTVCYVWSSIFMLLRLYLRLRNRKFGLADALTLTTFVLSTIAYPLSIWCGYLVLKIRGTFLHIEQLAMSFFFLNLTVSIIVPLTKSCIIALLQEVEISEFNRRILLSLQILFGLQFIGICIMNFFGCAMSLPGLLWAIIANPHIIPEAKNQLDQKQCIPRQQFIIFNGTFNAVLEIVIILCAISLVSRVKVGTTQKAGLILTFALGLFTFAASVISTYYLYKVHEQKSYNFITLADSFYSSGIWSCFEIYIGITIASIMPIRAALLAFVNRLSHASKQCLPKVRFGSQDTRASIPAKLSLEQEMALDMEVHTVLKEDKCLEV